MADRNEETIVELREMLGSATSRLDRIRQLLSEEVKYIINCVKNMTLGDILCFK